MLREPSHWNWNQIKRHRETSMLVKRKLRTGMTHEKGGGGRRVVNGLQRGGRRRYRSGAGWSVLPRIQPSSTSGVLEMPLIGCDPGNRHAASCRELLGNFGPGKRTLPHLRSHASRATARTLTLRPTAAQSATFKEGAAHDNSSGPVAYQNMPPRSTRC